MTDDKWGGKLLKVEWLFKPSTYGGAEHIMVNIDEYVALMDQPFTRSPFYVQTLCGKSLKFNHIFSVVRQKSGSVKNICIDCLMQSGSDETLNENIQVRKLRQERESDLPF